MSTESRLSEKELLRQIAGGSEKAFGELFTAYRKKLYTNIYRITQSREIAEDTVHDVFLKIWTNRKSLPEIENFNSYLNRMAQNQAYTGFRRLAKETLILAELRRGGDTDNNNPGQVLMAKEVKAFIQETIAKLTPQQKLVFLLSREEGLKQQEIADRLNISIATVKKHMVDALRYLRDEIGKSYGSQAVALFVIYNLSENIF
jgi:RNA polymerase sigma-70 factor (ECF subfamily)